MRMKSRSKWAIKTLGVACCVAVLGVSAVSRAADSAPTAKASPTLPWPQWRGPNRDAKSPETGLLKEWPEKGPKLSWETKDLGTGFSSLCVADGRIFSLGDTKEGCFAWAIGEKDGKPLWQTKIGENSNYGGYAGTRSTPTFVDGMIYVTSPHGDVVCLNASDGKEVWHVNMAKDFNGTTPGWGYSESVLVDGDNVICTPGGDKGTLLALDKKTGKPVWRCAEWKDACHYSSVIMSEIGGVHQYIQFTADSVAGVEAKTGKLLWRAERKGATAVIPTPVEQDGYVYVTSGYGVGCNCFQVTKDGDKFTAKEIYKNRDMQVHHGGVIVVGDYVYGLSDPGMLVCMDLKTGKVKWKERAPGKGSLVYAEGMLIARNEGGPGKITLCEASPDGYKESGTFEQPERSDKMSWPHPVIANGKLYIRDQGVLLCYDIKK